MKEGMFVRVHALRAEVHNLTILVLVLLKTRVLLLCGCMDWWKKLLKLVFKPPVIMSQSPTTGSVPTTELTCHTGPASRRHRAAGHMLTNVPPVILCTGLACMTRSSFPRTGNGQPHCFLQTWSKPQRAPPYHSYHHCVPEAQHCSF